MIVPPIFTACLANVMPQHAVSARRYMIVFGRAIVFPYDKCELTIPPPHATSFASPDYISILLEFLHLNAKLYHTQNHELF